MTDAKTDFEGGNATFMLANELKDVAERLAGNTGAEPAVALFGAAVKVLKEQYGDEAWAPLAQRWLQTLIEAEKIVTAYN